MQKADKTVEQLLDECACFDLRRTTRRVSNFYDQLIASSGITSPQRSLLLALSTESASITRLSTLLDVDRTSLRRMLDPLERDGLVSIAVDPIDNRGRIVGLTRKGRASLKAAQKHWQHAQETLFAMLGESNWRQLIGALRNANRSVRDATKDMA